MNRSRLLVEATPRGSRPAAGAGQTADEGGRTLSAAPNALAGRRAERSGCPERRASVGRPSDTAWQGAASARKDSRTWGMRPAVKSAGLGARHGTSSRTPARGRSVDPPRVGSILRHAGIDLLAPSIDAAAHRADAGETVADEVGRHVERAHAAAAEEHDPPVLRQAHVLAGILEIERLGAFDARDGELVRRTDVDQREVLLAVQPLLDLLGARLEVAVDVVRALDGPDHLRDVEDVVVAADV